MKFKRNLSYLLIVIGSILTIYVEINDVDNIYLLITGIVILMLGLYTVSRGISSKPDSEESYIKSEEEE